MQVWNVRHTPRGKYRMQKLPKNCHLCTITQLCQAISSQQGMYRQSEKICQRSIRPPHVLTIWWTSVHQLLRSFQEFGTPQQISIAFASWLCYCTDVAQRRSTKPCTMFGHLLRWYSTYTFLGALGPSRNFARCKIHFASKSCVLLYLQRYCTAFEYWMSAKLCGIQQWAPPIFGRAAITLGISPHSSFHYFTLHQQSQDHTQSLHSKVDKRSTLKDQVLFSKFHLHTSLQDHNEVVALPAIAVQVTLRWRWVSQAKTHNHVLLDQTLQDALRYEFRLEWCNS